MPKATLQMDLPAEDLAALQAQAAQQGVTVAELIGRFARRFRAESVPFIHPEVRAISGLIPAEIDAVAESRRHLLTKHQ